MGGGTDSIHGPLYRGAVPQLGHGGHLVSFFKKLCIGYVVTEIRLWVVNIHCHIQTTWYRVGHLKPVLLTSVTPVDIIFKNK